jgi:hypothetical protein
MRSQLAVYMLIPLAISVVFIWVTHRIVEELSGIQERLTEIRDQLARRAPALPPL